MDTIRKIGVVIDLLLLVIFLAAGSGSILWHQPPTDPADYSAYSLGVHTANIIFFAGLLVVSLVVYLKRSKE